MLSNKQIEAIEKTRGSKLPLDARIIGWFVFYGAITTLIVSVLLIIGFGQPFSSSRKTAVFSLVSVDTELSYGIYLSCIGLVNLVAGYGIAKGYKFGWYTMFISLICFIIDLTLRLSDDFIIIFVCISINLAFLVWLIWRRRYYNISWQRKNSD